jgi:transketolase
VDHPIGIDTFGKSANSKDLEKYFGFTPEQVANYISTKIADNKKT